MQEFKIEEIIFSLYPCVKKYLPNTTRLHVTRKSGFRLLLRRRKCKRGTSESSTTIESKRSKFPKLVQKKNCHLETGLLNRKNKFLQKEPADS